MLSFVCANFCLEESLQGGCFKHEVHVKSHPLWEQFILNGDVKCNAWVNSPLLAFFPKRSPNLNWKKFTQQPLKLLQNCFWALEIRNCTHIKYWGKHAKNQTTKPCFLSARKLKSFLRTAKYFFNLKYCITEFQIKCCALRQLEKSWENDGKKSPTYYPELDKLFVPKNLGSPKFWAWGELLGNADRLRKVASWEERERWFKIMTLCNLLFVKIYITFFLEWQQV